MAEAMRIRAAEKDGLVDLKVLMKHDMESGQRKDVNGKIIPAWFIMYVEVLVKGKVVFTGHLGPAVSKDPFFNIKLRGLSKGERIEVRWVDNRGDQKMDQTVVV
jgi:sulfur-oxidizing protein SoxZ